MQDRLKIVIFPTCPHCGKNNVAFYLVSERQKDSSLSVFFFTCGNCFSGVCGEGYSYLINKNEYFHFNDLLKVYPKPDITKAPAYTPHSVESDYIEAKTSLQYGNIKAACIMAGNAIETALIEHGATGGGLKDKIDSLAKRNVITQSLADWAHELKSIRNDAAHHAEKGTALEKKDAEDAVQFAETLFLYLYTLPGMVAARRETAKKTS